MAKPKETTIDATPERLAKSDAHDIAQGTGARRMADWPLARLYGRGQLAEGDPERNALLNEVGKTLERYWHGAGLIGYAGINLDAVMSGGSDKAGHMPTSEYACRCRGELTTARAQIGGRNWQVVIDIVVDGLSLEDAGRRCTLYHHRRTAAAVALDRLRGGLEQLAEVWGHLHTKARGGRILAFGERPTGMTVRQAEDDDGA